MELKYRPVESEEVCLFKQYYYLNIADRRLINMKKVRITREVRVPSKKLPSATTPKD